MEHETTDNEFIDPLAAALVREARLRDAVVWALGGHGNFPERPAGESRYWWRAELCKRAGLRWDGLNYIDETMI